MKESKAILVLEDGTFFEGRSFGAEGEAIGEVVFNTSMTGYQEILTDPSYKGQMVTMTYPEIGNYGVNPEDVESRRPFLEGFIVKEYHSVPSNFRSRGSLGAYLKKYDIVGIEGIDTRALTRHLREEGAKMGIISTVDFDRRRLRRKVKQAPGLVGQDLVKEVTCKKPYVWKGGGIASFCHSERSEESSLSTGRSFGLCPQDDTRRDRTRRFRVVAYDFGIKFNILRSLSQAGCDVKVVPASTPAKDILAVEPDGVFLSNGPGDPEPVGYASEAIAQLVGKVPIFGICLGHQLLARALGGKTYKLKFGHHGGNHPVMDLATRKVEITAQNHGFAVDVDSLKKRAELTHINLYDKTVEGLRLKKQPVFSVQYHPEASPGPHDSHYLFQRFIETMQ